MSDGSQQRGDVRLIELSLGQRLSKVCRALDNRAEKVKCPVEIFSVTIREDRRVEVLDLSVRSHHNELEPRRRVRVSLGAANAYFADAPDNRGAHLARVPLFGFFRSAVTADFGAGGDHGAQTTSDCEMDTRRKEGANER